MSQRSPVFLVNAATGEAVEGVLVSPLTDKHVADWRDEWRPFQIKAMTNSNQARLPAEQHEHWSWEQKEKALGALLAYRGFAIEADGVTQGMAFHRLTEVARLDTQKGKPLVYVDFVESAPWNRASVSGSQRYRTVGALLIRSAVALSMSEGFQGRIGLHSLRQADSFYRDTCRMTDLGPDKDCHGLRYFEMTAAQADEFANREKLL